MIRFKIQDSRFKKKCFMKYGMSGFTLIEMIVSLAIFSIVAVVALGALMKIVSANKKAQSLQSAMTNINFALESISREMRVGSDFSCYANGTDISTISSASVLSGPTGCQPFNSSSYSPPADGNGITVAFRSSHTNNDNKCNLIYAYRFVYSDSDKRWDIKKAAQDPSQSCTDSLNNNYSSIIDTNVVITGITVNISSNPNLSTVSIYYPLATFRISGYVGAREKERTYFDVQTAVSARVPSDQ